MYPVLRREGGLFRLGVCLQPALRLGTSRTSLQQPSWPVPIPALAQPGTALTLLVNHFIRRTDKASADFGASGSGRSSLSSKARAGGNASSPNSPHTAVLSCDRLQEDEPVQPCPSNLRGPFTAYLEKYGGRGQHRDLELIIYMVVDLLSLLIVALEQVNQDGGKWGGRRVYASSWATAPLAYSQRRQQGQLHRTRTRRPRNLLASRIFRRGWKQDK